MSPHKRATLVGACALALGLYAEGAATQKPKATVPPATAPKRAATAVPTPIPTPLPPERETRQNKGAAPERRVGRYENRNVSFVEAHRLVALFFGAMGINEHARVQVLRD